jgi:ribonuclease P protein component
MISRKHRFKGRKSLDYTYRKGRPAKHGALGIRAVPSRGEDYRLAVVVSKKIHKSAVRRNRIRRRIFEQFRKMRVEYEKPIKYDIIITAFSDELATIPAEQLAEDTKKLLNGAGIVLK